MASIESTLRTLRDVHGVFGSFVVSGSGSLVARDLPAAFESELFADIGPRILRLYETFSSGGEEMDACVLRYADHKIYIRKITWGAIGILSAVAVNMPALRMVSNLVVRRIDPEVSQSSQSGGPPAVRPVFPPVGALATPPPLPTAPLALALRPPVPPSRPPSAPPPAAPEQREATPGRPVRMYRGRPVVD